MPSYDKAITVFAPNGKLIQVEYAFEAVQRGTATIGLRGKDCVILAVEKKPIATIQDPRTIKKIQKIDNHIMCTFSGLQADARVLIDKARFESQSFRFQMEDEPSIQYISKSVATIQQNYTQKGGVRPFGVTMFFSGFMDGKPKLFQSEPSGALSEWRANAIGRNASTLREFMEKKWEEGLDSQAAIRLSIETLLEVVEDAKNIEICVAYDNNKFEMLDEETLTNVSSQIKLEKEQAEEQKKKAMKD